MKNAVVSLYNAGSSVGYNNGTQSIANSTTYQYLPWLHTSQVRNLTLSRACSVGYLYIVSAMWNTDGTCSAMVTNNKGTLTEISSASEGKGAYNANGYILYKLTNAQSGCNIACTVGGPGSGQYSQGGAVILIYTT